MKIISKYLVCFVLSIVTQVSYAQVADNTEDLQKIKLAKAQVVDQEKAELKLAIEAIHKRLDAQEITKAEADVLKQKEAEKHALNIQNRLAIYDHQLALLERNGVLDTARTVGDKSIKYVIQIGKSEDSDEFDRGGLFVGNKNDKKTMVYDRRTSSDLVFAIGFNNAITDGESLDDSPYKIGGSGFVELGWAWKTRVFENSNAVRLKYGFSFQWNKLDIKGNNYLVEDADGMVSIEPFDLDLKKSKFRTTNLVFPVHFEFGPSKKIEREDYFRYSTYRKFKFGIGGYGGLTLQTMQKLKYTENGKHQKDKFKDYNTNAFVYGLSSYVSWGNVGVYAKYDLSTLFRNQPVDQHQISLGLRFDMD